MSTTNIRVVGMGESDLDRWSLLKQPKHGLSIHTDYSEDFVCLHVGVTTKRIPHDTVSISRRDRSRSVLVCHPDDVGTLQEVIGSACHWMAGVADNRISSEGFKKTFESGKAKVLIWREGKEIRVRLENSSVKAGSYFEIEGGELPRVHLDLSHIVEYCQTIKEIRSAGHAR